MVTLLAQGEPKTLKQWVEHLVNCLTVGGVFIFFSLLLLGNNLVPWVLGDVYQPVTTNLIPPLYHAMGTGFEQCGYSSHSRL